MKDLQVTKEERNVWSVTSSKQPWLNYLRQANLRGSVSLLKILERTLKKLLKVVVSREWD